MLVRAAGSPGAPTHRPIEDEQRRVRGADPSVEKMPLVHRSRDGEKPAAGPRQIARHVAELRMRSVRRHREVELVWRVRVRKPRLQTLCEFATIVVDREHHRDAGAKLNHEAIIAMRVAAGTLAPRSCVRLPTD